MNNNVKGFSPKPRKTGSDKMKFEDMIAAGENEQGFTAQTPNGTAHAFGSGWNRDEPYTSGEVKPDPTRPAGRSTRTGE